MGMFNRFLLIFLFMLFSNNVFSAVPKDSIQIKGSDTMVNLIQAWTEAFMEINPNAFIAVTGGGSGTGIASLISGTTDIAVCSREMTEKEISMAKGKNVNPYKIITAMDGITVAVNPANPVKKLTIEEIADIFTGKISNWKMLGGNDAKIVLLSREINSGTHVYFKEHILNKQNTGIQEEFSPEALLLPSSQAIADEIAANTAAIGYFGMGYISESQAPVSIALNKTSKYITPTIENIKTSKYPISRPLFLYTNGEPKELIKDFIDFILSPDGQKIVLETDFVPIK